MKDMSILEAVQAAQLILAAVQSAQASNRKEVTAEDLVIAAGRLNVEVTALRAVFAAMPD